MENNDFILKVDNVTKIYKLGEIGGTTLKEEIQRLKAKIFKKEDPSRKIGAKNYNKGEKFEALSGISFEVRKGERIGIIGHNGAGKSTLLKLISRVTCPSSGAIYIDGRVASMLEVGTGFHPELTGRENIYMNGAILGMSKKEIDKKIEDIIDFSEVRQFIDTPVKRYSSGMYVKLAFSVAAHLDSEILIMDEVLAVGDVAFQNKCINKMREVSFDKKRTILYVSHNMNTIRQLCDRVIVLNKGKIIFDGDVETGIKFYLKEDKNSNTPSFDLSLLKRPALSLNHCTIQSVNYVGKTDTVFKRNEPLRMEVRWLCNHDVDDMLFRITFRNSEELAIGTCISKNTFRSKKGIVYSTILNLDTSLFSEDIYYVTISLINSDCSDTTVLLDFAEKCCNFKIEEDEKCVDSFTDWNTPYWGNVHLPIFETTNFKEEI